MVSKENKFSSQFWKFKSMTLSSVSGEGLMGDVLK
jgi:hypothetical protein